jgi:hypothetical protein
MPTLVQPLATNVLEYPVLRVLDVLVHRQAKAAHSAQLTAVLRALAAWTRRRRQHLRHHARHRSRIKKAAEWQRPRSQSPNGPPETRCEAHRVPDAGSSERARSMNAAFDHVRARSCGVRLVLRHQARVDRRRRRRIRTWGDYNRYSLPNDFIRLLRDDETGQAVDWKIEGTFILSPTKRRSRSATSPTSKIRTCTTPLRRGVRVQARAKCCEEITGRARRRRAASPKADLRFRDREAKRTGAIEKERRLSRRRVD